VYSYQLKPTERQEMQNIDNMTYCELKQIAALFSNASQSETKSLNAMVGKKCIIRTYSAGVFFGEISEKSGNEVIVKNARRMWQWTAAESISLSAVSIHGIINSKSKIAQAVDSIWLEAIELIPCTDKAIESIESAKNVKAQ
jgi:hypothetical protein